MLIKSSSYFPGRCLKALVRGLQFLISTALLVAAWEKTIDLKEVIVFKTQTLA